MNVQSLSVQLEQTLQLGNCLLHASCPALLNALALALLHALPPALAHALPCMLPSFLELALLRRAYPDIIYHICRLLLWPIDKSGMQGMLPCIAPLLPHLAEDAWEHLPWPAPAKSVFQAGWFQSPSEWSTLSQVRIHSHPC